MTEQEQKKTEQPLGFHTPDEQIVEIPFFKLKPIFALLRQFEIPIAAMNNINDDIINQGKSFPVYPKDIDPTTNNFTKEFIESCKPKVKQEEKKTILVDSLGNTQN